MHTWYGLEKMLVFISAKRNEDDSEDGKPLKAIAKTIPFTHLAPAPSKANCEPLRGSKESYVPLPSFQTSYVGCLWWITFNPKMISN